MTITQSDGSGNRSEPFVSINIFDTKSTLRKHLHTIISVDDTKDLIKYGCFPVDEDLELILIKRRIDKVDNSDIFRPSRIEVEKSIERRKLNKIIHACSDEEVP